jgi:hypothetical protein
VVRRGILGHWTGILKLTALILKFLPIDLPIFTYFYSITSVFEAAE